MGKHLTLDQRITIQIELERNTPIKAIARMIGKAPRTVAREIEQRRERRDESRYGRANGRCVRRDKCPNWASCPGAGRCARYEEERCATVTDAPFVCNGCARSRVCTLTRFFYRARKAHEGYRATLRQRRLGANISEAELERLDGIVSPAVRNGRSPHQIAVSERDRIGVCDRTLYRYFRQGLFTALRGDLKRACRLRPRKGRRTARKLDTKCRQNRTYQDYEAFVSEHPLASVVQMDLVIGRVGGACILTLHFVRLGFQVGRLLPDKCAASVLAAIEEVAASVGPFVFARLFEVILTDNGTEFSDPSRIETDAEGRSRSRVFYCDPYNTNQKSQCERNHELVRECLPKGASLDALRQEDLDRVFSHINSYARKSLGDRRPADLFDEAFGPDARLALGIRKIAPRDIVLTPALSNR